MGRILKRRALAVLILVLVFAGAFAVLFRVAWRLMRAGSQLLDGSALVSTKVANVLSLGSLLATLVYLCLTVGIAIIAVRELSHLQSASRADFFLRLTREFFTKEAQRITELCASDCLKYVSAEKTKDSYFVVDREKVASTSKIEATTNRLTENPLYSCFEIDDAVMGPLDDVRRLREDGVLDMDTVDEVFGYYFLAIWDNSEIERYRSALEREHQEYTKIPEFMHKLRERQKGKSIR